MRTFITLEIPPEIKAYLQKIAADLNQQLPAQSVRWVKPAQMHLTLRFLGNTAVSKIQPLRLAVRESLNEVAPFTLKLGQLGAFPHRRKPRIFWVGLAGEVKQLYAAQAKVETALVPLGWLADQKSFKPHLTIGRVKIPQQLKNQPWAISIEPMPIKIATVHLIQSELSSAGSIYTTLDAIQL